MTNGYVGLLLDGMSVTLQLSVGALAIAVILGLVMAGAKQSGSTLLYAAASCYTTFMRGIPDIALMLLIFFSLQMGINQLTDLLGWAQLDINPFSAGVVAIGTIYGAYFTETFRGAIMAVSPGQLEAARAYGLSGWAGFRLILFPQLMRFALPGIANNWLVMVKATALVSLVGLSDVTKGAQDAGKGSGHMLPYLCTAAVFYLAVTSLSGLMLFWLKKHYSQGVREAEL
jgi:histidine transport system permease protein